MDHIGQKKYWAFVSYSSKDAKWGKWLHNKLEKYPIPKDFQGAELFDGAVLGKNLNPCFRDRDELSGSAELGPAILKALKDTRTLIVLCSKNSAKSEWVNKEIEDFKAIGGEKNILALIIDGEPNSGGDTECFPPALRYPAEPLAGDLRKEGDGKERGFLKILAGIAELNFDDLYRRHERAQRKKRLILSGVASAIILSLAALTAFAFKQRERAEEQSLLAQQKEAEAVVEKDKARKSLSKLYFDRALKAESSSESLAWSLKAVEIDSALLGDSQASVKIQEWMGPWPAPDSCLGTGLPEISFGSREGGNQLIQREEKRLLIQTGERSWNLINYEQRSLISTELFPKGIRQFTAPENAPWFVIYGGSHLEIRSWADGTILYEESFEWNIDNLACHLSGVVVETSHSRNQSILAEIQVDSQKNVRKENIMIAGEVMSLVSFLSDEKLTLLYTLRKSPNDKGSYELNALVRTKTDDTWKKQSLESIAEVGASWIEQRENLFPLGFVRLWLEKDHSIFLDLDTLKIHPNDEKRRLIGSLKTSEEPRFITTQFQNNAVIITLTDLNAQEIPLLDGQAVRKGTFLKESQMVAGWDEGQHALLYQRVGEKTQVVPISSPHPSQSISVWEIEEIQRNVLLLHCGNSIIIVGLRDEAAPIVWAAGVSKYEDVLEFEVNAEGAKLALLSHDRRVISYYDEVQKYAEILLHNYTEKAVEDSKVSWLQVDDYGKTRSLHQPTDYKVKQVTYLGSESASLAWIESSWSPSNSRGTEKDLMVFPSGILALRSYGDCLVLSPKGEEIWRRQLQAFAPFVLAGKELALIQESESITLRELRSFDQLWEIPLKGEIKDIQVNSSEERALVILESSKGFYGTEGEPVITRSLLSVSLETGDYQTSAYNIHGDEALFQKKDIYNRKSQIYSGVVDGLIHSWKSESGGTEHILRQVKGNELVETLRWSHEKSTYIRTWWELKDGSLLAQTSKADSSQNQLTHFYHTRGEWNTRSIMLPSDLQKFSPSPSGKSCVFLCKNHAILYNLLEREPIETQLTTESQYERVSYSDKLIWSPDSERFYFWNRNSIQEFDAGNGNHLRSISSHHRGGDTDLTSVSISPSGEWLGSGDNQGKIITSPLTTQPLSLDDFRTKTLFLGGLVIENDDDVAVWKPATIE